MWKEVGDRGYPDPLPLSGVGDGTRTHNARNHNPVLCQLNYTHQIQLKTVPLKALKNGTPEGIRTPGLLLRRQLLYPTELLAHSDKLERVTGIEPASPAWKAGALAIVLHPRTPSAQIVSLYILP